MSGVMPLPDSTLTPMAKLNNHVTQVVVAGDDNTTPFTGSSMVAKAVKSYARTQRARGASSRLSLATIG